MNKHADVKKMTAELDAWQASVKKSLAGEDYSQPVEPPAKKKKKAA